MKIWHKVACIIFTILTCGLACVSTGQRMMQVEYDEIWVWAVFTICIFVLAIFICIKIIKNKGDDNG